MRTKVEFTGGAFDGLWLDLGEGVDEEVAINLVRSAMYFHIKKDPPEIIEAREMLQKVG